MRDIDPDRQQSGVLNGVPNIPNVLKACPAPAKLNLFLHVVGQRADGYHLLQTVFQLIDLCDILDFAVREDGVIQRLVEINGLPAAQDLTVRAAQLLQNATRTSFGATITLHKKIPLGAGLGGGSSDAATTLLALNHLWRTGLSRAELMTLGLALGADVPFFIFGQNAFGEGVGEQLQPVGLPARWFVIVKPSVTVSTNVIFKTPELTRNTKPIKISDFSQWLKTWQPDDSLDFGRNDLQDVTSKLFPPVAQVLKWLKRQKQMARMTGSGACVFCSCASEQAADLMVRQMSASADFIDLNAQIFKARGLPRHPLQDWLE